MGILVFDSGIGGLSILRELRLALPGMPVSYVADDAGFPYGDWEEEPLCDRLEALFRRYIALFRPQLCVVACNTATTIAIDRLRQGFPSTPFVGTVPAITPAAERTASGLISVLATPGTVDRDYTRNLINEFAADKWVTLVGAPDLAKLAEMHLRGEAVSPDILKAQIAPCFVEKDGKRTDIVVLGCTHYPFMANMMRKYAPWPVDWLNPAEAIASRAKSVLGDTQPAQMVREDTDRAVFTSDSPPAITARLVGSFGLKVVRS